MAVDDIFRDLGQHLRVYWEHTFDEIPDAPGIYAWYYPLRVVSLELEPLLRELTTVFNFDSEKRGPVMWHSDVTLCWRRIHLEAREVPRYEELPGALPERWNSLKGDEAGFANFRQQLLAASILLPPLYIGKAEKLQTRCFQHIRGNNDSGFNARFETFARENGLASKQVKKLIFSCVRVQDSAPLESGDTPEASVARLLEGILQVAGCPPYGSRP